MPIFIHFYTRFGVCCLFITSTSGAEINNNCSYIQNPNYPNAYGTETAISFKVNKCSAGILIFRWDILSDSSHRLLSQLPRLKKTRKKSKLTPAFLVAKIEKLHFKCF